jgi:hypothetical protein
VVLVNVQDHDDIFGQFVGLNPHRVEFDWNDQTKETKHWKYDSYFALLLTNDYHTTPTT